MTDFVTLSCPSCGGKLEITSDIDRFACAHCGTEHVVKRGGGLVSLAPVTEEIRRVRAGVDKTASELAIKRLTEEIEQLEKQRPSPPGYGGCLYVVAGLTILVTLIFVGVQYASDYVPTYEEGRKALVVAVPSVIGFISLVVLTALGAKADRQQKAQFEKTVSAEFEARLQAKEEELERHKALVSAW